MAESTDYVHYVVNDYHVPLDEYFIKQSSQHLIFLQNISNKGKSRSVHELVTTLDNEFSHILTLDDDDKLLFNPVQDLILGHNYAYPKRLTNDKNKIEQNIAFKNAINLHAKYPNEEIAFILDLESYKKNKKLIENYLFYSCPELVIYDIVTRATLKDGMYFNKYIMNCEYQSNGMTANFAVRLKRHPTEFCDYYMYVLRRTRNIPLFLKSLARYMQARLYKSLQMFDI